MDVVSLLNSMYIKFDQLSVKYRVYKVGHFGVVDEEMINK